MAIFQRKRGESEEFVSLSLPFILNVLIPALRVDSFVGLTPTDGINE